MIFVLGSKGFVGSAILDYLRSRGEEVEGIDLHNYDTFVGRSCRWFINANGSSSKRMADQAPDKDFEANVSGVVRTFRDFRIDTYLHISSIDVYNVLDDPARNAEDAAIDTRTLSHYGFDKWLSERVVEHHADRYVIFRLGGMIGKGLRKGPAFDILDGKPIWQSPESKFLFLDTAIVADCLWRLRDHTRETYNLVASPPLSLTDFSAIAGRPITEVKGEAVLEYHVCNDKARAFVDIPTSRDCVERFVGRGKTL